MLLGCEIHGHHISGLVGGELLKAKPLNFKIFRGQGHFVKKRAPEPLIENALEGNLFYSEGTKAIEQGTQGHGFPGLCYIQALKASFLPPYYS
jgi:hypothetical protein